MPSTYKSSLWTSAFAVGRNVCLWPGAFAAGAERHFNHKSMFAVGRVRLPLEGAFAVGWCVGRWIVSL